MREWSGVEWRDGGRGGVMERVFGSEPSGFWDAYPAYPAFPAYSGMLQRGLHQPP